MVAMAILCIVLFYFIADNMNKVAFKTCWLKLHSAVIAQESNRFMVGKFKAVLLLAHTALRIELAINGV